MNLKKSNLSKSIFVIVAALGMSVFASNAFAHCDFESGPVAVAAKQALKTGDVNDVLVWVTADQTRELTTTYQQAKTVYEKGGPAEALAEQYFMENAVRLHRLAEGMSYTGLKPVQPAPEAIQVAERSLETGNLTPTNDRLVDAMNDKVSDLFEQARAARKHKDEDLAAGREWTDAYVRYVTYIEGLDSTIQAGATHGIGEATQGAGH